MRYHRVARVCSRTVLESRIPPDPQRATTRMAKPWIAGPFRTRANFHTGSCFLYVRGTALPATNFLLPFFQCKRRKWSRESGKRQRVRRQQARVRAFDEKLADLAFPRPLSRPSYLFYFFLTNRRGCFTKGRFIPFILW